jgi:type IV fimbrial biogenesis protein FimT
MRNANGYTLLELMITIAVLAILLLIAIPAWRGMMAQSRTTVLVSQLREAIYFARSEAMKRGVTVTLCKSADQKSCSGLWSDGQIVFLDWNGSGQVQSSKDILRVFDGLPVGSSLTWKGRLGVENYLQVKPSTVTEITNGTFYYCPFDRNSKYARDIVLSSTGRVSVKKGQCS